MPQTAQCYAAAPRFSSGLIQAIQAVVWPVAVVHQALGAAPRPDSDAQQLCGCRATTPPMELPTSRRTTASQSPAGPRGRSRTAPLDSPSGPGADRCARSRVNDGVASCQHWLEGQWLVLAPSLNHSTVRHWGAHQAPAYGLFQLQTVVGPRLLSPASGEPMAWTEVSWFTRWTCQLGAVLGVILAAPGCCQPAGCCLGKEHHGRPSGLLAGGLRSKTARDGKSTLAADAVWCELRWLGGWLLLRLGLRSRSPLVQSLRLLARRGVEPLQGEKSFPTFVGEPRGCSPIWLRCFRPWRITAAACPCPAHRIPAPTRSASGGNSAPGLAAPLI